MKIDTGFLDGLRALSALWVLTAHCFIWAGGTSPLDPKMAVDLFMILSGFLMTYTVGLKADREPPSESVTWINFYIRRFFRIAPAYYMTLFLVVVLAPQFLGGYERYQSLHPEIWAGSSIYDPARINYDAQTIWWHVTFIFGLIPSQAFSTFLPDWSLGLEMQFYAVFPLIFVIMRRFNAVAVSAAIFLFCAIGTKIYAIGVQHGVLTAFPEPALLLFKLPMFLVGVLIAGSLGFLRTSRTTPVIAAMCITCFEARHYGFQGLVLVFLVLAVAALTISRDNRIGALLQLDRLMNNPLCKKMAELSYSVYLVHGIWLSIVGSKLAQELHARNQSNLTVVAAVWVAVMVLTYGSSWLVYSFVEVPGILLGSQMGKVIQARVA